MKQPGLDDRHRDQNGEISKKHGNTLVKTLRGIYGPSFAAGFGPTDTLSHLLKSDPAHASLSQLRKDHDANTLANKIAAQG